MKKTVVLILAATLLVFTLAACGKKDKKDDITPDIPLTEDGEIAPSGTESYHSLEHPDSQIDTPHGEEDAKGWLYTYNYDNGVKLSCELLNGDTVTLGMGDAEIGVNAIYLNPTCSNPNGAVFYIEGSRGIYIRFDVDQDYVETKLADFPKLDAKNIAAYRWGENTFGVDASYNDEYNFGVAWQNNLLSDGKGQYGDTLLIEVRDRMDDTLMGMLKAEIFYDADINRYCLTSLTLLDDPTGDVTSNMAETIAE